MAVLYRSLNPTTEELLQEFAEHSVEETERALHNAAAFAPQWRKFSFDSRVELLLSLADHLEGRADILGRLITLEMGKPLVDAVREIKKCADLCRAIAQHAPLWLKDEELLVGGDQASLVYQPLGPLFGIMPWNYPFWQAFRFAVPALMAGNVAIIKHAPNVPQTALAIERAFLESGFPKAALQNLFLSTQAAGRVIADARIRGVALTGSRRAGRAVAEIAGRHLKPVVLELGGSDPFIVLKDANLEKTVTAAVLAKNTNNGQVCVAAKRYIIHRDLYSEFLQCFAEGMKSRRLGDPLQSATENGPMARADLREALQEQVQRSVEQGARIIAQGQAPTGKGFFVAPTVIENAKPGTPAYDEELFGPVAAVFSVASDQEAIALANDTIYGLGATIWSENLQHAKEVAQEIEAGQVFVNTPVRSDPQLPFGGVKDSGFGRELGREGIRQFTNLKTQVVRELRR